MAGTTPARNNGPFRRAGLGLALAGPMTMPALPAPALLARLRRARRPLSLRHGAAVTLPRGLRRSRLSGPAHRATKRARNAGSPAVIPATIPAGVTPAEAMGAPALAGLALAAGAMHLVGRQRRQDA